MLIQSTACGNRIVKHSFVKLQVFFYESVAAFTHNVHLLRDFDK